VGNIWWWFVVQTPGHWSQLRQYLAKHIIIIIIIITIVIKQLLVPALHMYLTTCVFNPLKNIPTHCHAGNKW